MNNLAHGYLDYRQSTRDQLLKYLCKKSFNVAKARDGEVFIEFFSA
jgi:hypothetical protein